MRYRTLATAFREHFGRPARKIPLDAGSTCPNRDGTISRGGCLFCDARGSGAGLAGRGLSLAEQWLALTARLRAKTAPPVLLAYLQAHSNTHGPLDRLRRILDEVAALPDVGGLCLGTRPDCLDPDKLDLLAAAPLPFLRLEIGLQTVNDAVLEKINRGHDAACFARAVRLAAERGLAVTAHLMAGLPGEAPGDFLRAVDFVAALPVAGVKFHNLLVLADAPLASLYEKGDCRLLERSEYLDLLCAALPRLRPDMVVERLFADPAPGALAAPAWAADKAGLLARARRLFEERDVRQGAAYPARAP